MQFKSKSFFAALGSFLFVSQLHAATIFITDGDSVDKLDGSTLTPNFVGTLTDPSLFPASGFTGLAIGPEGNLYVGATNPAEIFKVNPSTGQQVGSGPFVPFTADNSINVQNPQGMKFGPNGNLYIADVTTSNVNIYNSTGGFVSANGTGLVQPTSLAFDSQGGLYVSDASGIEKFNSANNDFEPLVVAQTGGLGIASDLAFGSDGKLYIVDQQQDEIWSYDTADGLKPYIAFTPTQTSLFEPVGLAFDGSGNLFVSGSDVFALSAQQGEVLEFDSAGNPLGAAVTGLNNPTFLAIVPEPTCLMGLSAAMLALRRRRNL